MEEIDKKKQPMGFKKGLNAVYNNCTAAQYAACLAETREICTTTEARSNSISSFYSKMNGKAPTSVAESEKLAKVFARYGVTDWQGVE